MHRVNGRNFTFLKLHLLWLVVVLCSFANARDLTLENIRRELDGQHVMILGDAFPPVAPAFERYTPEIANKLVDWFRVDGTPETGFQRSKGVGDRAPISIRGQTAQIVRIEETRSVLETRTPGGTDVFGKPIVEGAVKNPYITVVVQMADGSTHYGATGYYNTLVGRTLQLMSRIERNRAQIGGYLESLRGKTLYKLGYTQIYRPDAALSDLLSYSRRTLAREYGVENLTSMKVVDSKYLEAENAAVLKVSLPSGATQLLFGDLQFYDSEYSYPVSQLERMGIRAVERIPPKFTSRELASIRKGEIFRGMSEDALYASWGYSTKTNDWGRGGKQHIYGTSQYVYITNGVISDWQSLR